MRCVESEEISALIDGELDPERRDLVASHIRQCGECGDEKERLLALSAIVREAGPVRISASLDERVIHSYREHFARTGWIQRLFAGRLALPVPVAAAALLLAVVGAMAAYKAGQMSSEEQVFVAPEPPAVEIRRHPAIEPPSVQNIPVPIDARETPTRVVTRIVNVCRQGRRSPDARPFQPVAPRPKSPVLTATMTDNGYFTDLRLAGFEPPAELNAQIIKGVKK